MPSLEPDDRPILLVEESPSDRALIERIFPERLMVVRDAEAALDVVRRQSFAAILLAHVLPGRSGLDLLRDLRAAGHTTPIVLLAESGEEGMIASALCHGADACIVKQAGFERMVPVAVAGVVRERWEAPAPAGNTPPEPCEVEHDRDKVRAIAYHLLSNAIKFTPAGRVSVSIARTPVGGIVVTVRDTGIGLPPEAREVIFDDFRQLDGSSTRRYEGLGLGLGIVKRYVGLLRGAVDLKSALGEGTTITVRLPPLASDGQVNAPPAGPPSR